MNKFPLDLSKFKRVQADKQTTTLKHSDGHEIRIAHKSLQPEMRKQLDKLPMHMAKGGPVKNYAYAGEVEGETAAQDPRAPVTVNVNASPEKDPEEGVFERLGRSLMDKLAGPPPGSNVQPTPMPSMGEIGRAAGNAVLGPPPGTQLNNQGNFVPAPPPQSMQVASLDPNIGMGGGEPQAQPQQGMGADPYGNEAAIAKQIAALDLQRQGQQQSAQAMGNLGVAQAGVEQGYQQQQLSNQEVYANANKELEDDRKALQSDIASGQIDPEHFVKNMSTGDKILNGLGLILGGMGAGLTGGPNLAFESMQRNIDRDIASQRDELGKKQNLLAHNMQTTSNLRAATELTRMQTNDMVASKLKMEALKAQDAIQKGNLLNIAGLFDAESAKLQHNLAIQKVMMGQQQGSDPEAQFRARMQYLRMNGGEKMADDMEKKHVPGVGQASMEIPEKVRSELISRQDLQEKIEDLQRFSSKHSGSVNPAIIKEGSAKASLVQDAYRRANQQGVFKESEAHFVSGIVSPNPTQLFADYRAGKGYQEMGKDNLHTLNNLKKGYGLPPGSGHTEAETKVYKGVTYKRGPNGEAIPVKKGK